jgi:hypothetical protein
VEPEALARPEVLKPLLDHPASTVTFLVGNGEEVALAAWKGLRAMGVANLYVVEGGINRWLDLYPVPACVAQRTDAPGRRRDALEYQFAYAAGDRLPASRPDLASSKLFRSPCGELVAAAGHAAGGHPGITWPTYEFTKRVKLKARAAVKGGCG